MRNAQGNMLVMDPNGTKTEHDTITCGHCNGVHVMAPKDAYGVGRYCTLCARHLCPGCAQIEKCTPFEKRLEAIERSTQLMQAMGI